MLRINENLKMKTRISKLIRDKTKRGRFLYVA